MLITAALSLLVSSSPGVSAQRNITATPPPFDPLPEDPLPSELPTHVPTLSPTPTLIQPTTTPAPITPIPRPQSQDLIFAANVIDGQVSVTLYNPVGIEWVQIWVGTPDLDTLHMEWYDLAATATCTGTTCTVLTNLTVNPGDYTVYIQPWSDATGFIQNELEGWLGPVSFERTQFTSIPSPTPTATSDLTNSHGQPSANTIQGPTGLSLENLQAIQNDPFIVNDGDVGTLIDTLKNFDDPQQCPATANSRIIVDGIYSINARYQPGVNDNIFPSDYVNGNIGLPVIRCDLTIEDNINTVIERNPRLSDFHGGWCNFGLCQQYHHTKW